MKQTPTDTDGITTISAQSLIALREQAKPLSLSGQRIRARQGGAYLSSFKGRGMEFEEARIYMPGDDIRNMDWRVTARTGNAHTKVFREERERPVLLWLDLNASMMFATRGAFKAVVASRIAAMLAWSAVQHNDRLGALIFAGDQHHEIRPRRGKNAALEVIGVIARHTAWQQQTVPQARNMQVALSRLRKVARPGSLVFMLSDFREMSHQAEVHLANIARHSDVVMIHISDPIEDQLPPGGHYLVSDGDSVVNLNTTDKIYRERYHRRFDSHRQHLQRLCRQNHMFYLPVSTQDDILERLQNGLGLRASTNKLSRSKLRHHA